MGWSIGYDQHWRRDIGYGVPAICDHPECGEKIDRGLSYVCGGNPRGGMLGCGLYFCAEHLAYALPGAAKEDTLPVPLCGRCCADAEPFTPKPDLHEWMAWKLTNSSWEQWRRENPDEVASLHTAVNSGGGADV